MVLNDAGVIGYSLNGKSFPATAARTSAKVGDWVLIHYFNEGTQIHPMHLHQFDQIVVAKDGYPLDQPVHGRHAQRGARRALLGARAARRARRLGVALPHPPPRRVRGRHVRHGHRGGRRMRALVVYESMFGNTGTLARAIAEGLGPSAEAVDVGSARDTLDDVDLLVAGGPTHALSLSRASTRKDAGTKGADPDAAAGIGRREWIDALPSSPGTRVATFDTKVRRPRLPGSAAKTALKRLRDKGLQTVGKPATFWVDGTEGPLVDGEEARARAWGADLVHP